MASGGLEHVIHPAAEVGVDQNMHAVDRCVSVNDGGTAVLLRAQIDRAVKRVVVASSMRIYGEGRNRTQDGAAPDDVCWP